MKSNFLLVVCMGSLLLSCRSRVENLPNHQIELPFYNESTFTPEWIETDDVAYSQIHTVDSFLFQNQNGDTITHRDVVGKVHVANFFFSICAGICPKMTRNLGAVRDSFSTDERVKIISYSVMPWVDSVARLQEYATIHHIDSKQWNLLTGEKDAIYDLARNSYFADEGFGKTVTDAKDFLHTEKMLLIDQKMRIRGVYNGTIPLEINRMIDDIKLLLAEG